MPLLKPRADLNPLITIGEEHAWAKAAKDPKTQIAALAHGLVEWVRMQRWITKHGNHPRVVRWLAKHPPPAHWTESPEAWAYTEMPFAPGWLGK